MGKLHVNGSCHVGLKIVIIAEEDWDSKTKVEIQYLFLFFKKVIVLLRQI